MIENIVWTSSLKLLSAALNQKECPDFDRTLWPEIKKELQAQAVIGFAGDMLQKSDLLSGEEKQQMHRLIVVNTARFLKLMTQQTEALLLLEANGIPAVVLKGTACARYYEKPQLRQFGDIDLLVLPDDYDKALTLFCEKGYIQLDATDSLFRRHIGFSTPSGFEIELHRFFSSSPNKDQNALLDQWLFEKIPHAQKIQLQKFSVSVLPPLENGLVILGHINQHLPEGLGLRQIADWMQYTKAHLSDAFWKEQFAEKAAAIGMADLAKTLTRMCQLYLGLSEELTWCRDADDGLAEELMLYILKRGNFGSKIKKDSLLTISTVHHFASPAKAFRYLTECGMIHMQEAGLKPLKAFAWIYQIGHMLRKTAARKSRKTLGRELKQGTEEIDLLKRLRVTKL